MPGMLKTPEIDFHYLMMPTGSRIKDLKDKKHGMMLACLIGGMSYQEAKAASDAEFDHKIEEAEKEYKKAMSDWEQKGINDRAAKPVKSWWIF